MAIRILGALVKRYVISTQLAKDAFQRLWAAAESLWLRNGFDFDVDEARTKERDVQIARELQLTREEAMEHGLQVPRLGSELGLKL